MWPFWPTARPAALSPLSRCVFYSPPPSGVQALSGSALLAAWRGRSARELPFPWGESERQFCPHPLNGGRWFCASFAEGAELGGDSRRPHLSAPRAGGGACGRLNPARKFPQGGRGAGEAAGAGVARGRRGGVSQRGNGKSGNRARSRPGGTGTFPRLPPSLSRDQQYFPSCFLRAAFRAWESPSLSPKEEPAEDRPPRPAALASHKEEK